MTAPITNSYYQLRDDAGEPAVGWTLTTYEAGTSTLKDTYKDYNQVATNTNPIVFDSTGSAVIWLDGAYKFIIKDADGNLINTQDDIQSYADVNLDGLTATVAELNATDTSVITVGDANYTVQLIDRGKTILYSTLLTVSRNVYLPKAVDAGNGFFVWVKSYQLNASTERYQPRLTPDTGEKIDGLNAYPLKNYLNAICVICDGSNWVVKSNSRVSGGYYSTKDVIPIVDTGSHNTLFTCNSSTGSYAIPLPAISTVDSGLLVHFKKIDNSANTIILNPNGADLIDNSASLSLTKYNEAYSLRTNRETTPNTWFIVGEVTSTSLFVTGDAKPTFTTSQAGWVLMNDGSIGNTGSGATTRANPDTEDLFKLLWTNVSDTYCPVSGGRGASANDDWTANKNITLTAVLGRAIASAGAGAGLTSRALGSHLGEENHVLTTAELASHDHDLQFYPSSESSLLSSGGSHRAFDDPGTLTTETTGSGNGHNTMQPTVFMNILIKL